MMGIVLIAIGITPLIVWMVLAKPLPSAVYAVVFCVIVFGLALILVAMIPQLVRYGNIEYIITNQRFVVQTGFMVRDTRFLDLDKIMDVYVHVGVIDRTCGTGTVCASNEANFFRRYPTYAFKIVDPFMRSTLWTMRAAMTKNAQLPLVWDDGVPQNQKHPVRPREAWPPKHNKYADLHSPSQF